MSEAKTDLKIDLNNLDKSNWKTYRFDEIAKNISERVDPNNTDLKVYVGLEHIDSESLHIKRHGSPDDVNGTKLRFYKGDIIFGRRRAYQRKAGIATWDGFCSAHALVLRANPDVIDPQLFPFFLHSDLFMNRAIDISVGSLSPTINWGTLKHQEFRVPPKEIHNALVKLFRNGFLYTKSLQELREYQEALFNSLSKSIYLKSNGKTQNLGDITRLIMGQSPPGKSYNTDGQGVPFLQGNAEFGRVHPSHEKFTTSAKKIAPESSILMSVRAPVGDLNIANIEYCIGRGLAAIDVKDKVLRTYIYYFLKFSKKELEKNSTGSTFKAINKDVISQLKLIVPERDELIRNMQKITSIIEAQLLTEKKLEHTNCLKKTLTNKVF